MKVAGGFGEWGAVVWWLVVGASEECPCHPWPGTELLRELFAVGMVPLGPGRGPVVPAGGAMPALRGGP